jgi:hypothetical protein
MDAADIFILLLFIVFICEAVYKCWKYCSGGQAKHRSEKEATARQRIDEYKQQQQQQQQLSHDNDNTQQPIEYKCFEMYYQGSTYGQGEGYGIGEMHLSISKEVDEDGKRQIVGCGIRELEYTEIIKGYIDSNGNAEWIEQTRRQIAFNVPGRRIENEGIFLTREPYGHYHLQPHWGQVSIRSIGKFNFDMTSFEGTYYGKDECNCNDCRIFWSHWARRGLSTTSPTITLLQIPQLIFGLPVRFCPDEERKIGEYITFQLKVDKEEVGDENINETSEEEDAYHRMA